MVVKKFMSVHGKFSAPNGFARPLGCLLNKPKSKAKLASFSKKDGTASFCYQVPHTVCRKDGRMMVSAMMATFDELSTVGYMQLDKSLRWGVSTNLSTTALGSARVGDELLMEVAYDKMGRNLGFCHMKLKNAKTGMVLAQGQHIKYMPVSWLYDNVLSLPFVLPIFLNLLFTFNKAGEAISRTFFGKKVIPAEPSGEDVEVTDNLDNIAEGFYMQEDKESGGWVFEAKQRMCNPMSFHGGAAAMAAETAFRLHCQKEGLDVMEVTRVDMNYLSAINKSSSKLVSVQIEDIPGDDALSKAVRGSLTQSGQKRMLFELHFR
jgi:hypothetical protein